MASCLLPWIAEFFQNDVNTLRKEFAPKGANSSLLELTIIEKGCKMKVTELLPMNMNLFTLTRRSPVDFSIMLDKSICHFRGVESFVAIILFLF